VVYLIKEIISLLGCCLYCAVRCCDDLPTRAVGFFQGVSDQRVAPIAKYLCSKGGAGREAYQILSEPSARRNTDELFVGWGRPQVTPSATVAYEPLYHSE
jgi:hypothetical protein